MWKGKFIFYLGRTQTLFGEKADALNPVSEALAGAFAEVQGPRGTTVYCVSPGTVFSWGNQVENEFLI